jgi:hypothetical protein
MVFYFCGYAMTLSALEQLAIARTGKTVPIVDGIEPYVEEMKRALKQPINTLEKSFDDLFIDVRPVVLPNKTPGGEAEAGVILVRVDGDPVERPEIFRETNGDKRVKKVVEACLGLTIGPFLSYVL